MQMIDLMKRLAELDAQNPNIVQETDQLRTRYGPNSVNKVPRKDQTDYRNIPVGNHPDSNRKFTDQDRERSRDELKSQIKVALGKHTTPNLPEQDMEEGGSIRDVTSWSSRAVQRLGHADDPGSTDRDRPRSVGMYFYDVKPGQEGEAAALGIKQTKSGKWAKTKYNTSGGTFDFQKGKADQKFGPGKWWEPKDKMEQGVGEDVAGDYHDLRNKIEQILIKNYGKYNSRDEIIDAAKSEAEQAAQEMGLDRYFDEVWKSALAGHDVETNFGDDGEGEFDYTDHTMRKGERGMEESLQECGMMGDMGAMSQPRTPASINMTAASGEELSGMLKDIMSLAGMSKDSELPVSTEPAAQTLEPAGPPEMDSTTIMRSVIDKMNPADDEEDGEEKVDEYDTTPNPQTTGYGSMTPAGDDLHGQKKQYPAAQPGDNAMTMEQQLMAEYKKFINEAHLSESGRQSFVILDPSLIDKIEQMVGTAVDQDEDYAIVWSHNPNTTEKLMSFAKNNPTRLKISNWMASNPRDAQPTGDNWSQDNVTLSESRNKRKSKI